MTCLDFRFHFLSQGDFKGVHCFLYALKINLEVLEMLN